MSSPGRLLTRHIAVEALLAAPAPVELHRGDVVPDVGRVQTVVTHIVRVPGYDMDIGGGLK